MSEKVKEELLEQLARQNPQALLLEPRDIYDEALVDITDDPGGAFSGCLLQRK